MHPLVYVLIQAILLGSLCFPCFISRKEKEEYATCFKSFQCGRLSNLSYPFWGGTRSLSCGYPGFELNCDGHVPLLNISSISYRLLDIDFHTYTLRVARQDLWNNTCPNVLHKTTLDPVHFEYSPGSSDRDLTLYYGCAANPGLLNQFNCSVGGVTTVNVFDASSGGPGSNVTCNGSISVPVNRKAATALQTPTDSSIRVLQEALASGFSIQWSANNQNCENCRQSKGACGFNQDTGATACITRKAWTRSLAVAVAGPPSPAFGQTEEPVGVSPIQSPSYAPESGDYYSEGGGGGGLALIVIFFITFSVIICCCLKSLSSPDRPNQGRRKHAAEKLLLQIGSAPKIYKYSEIMEVTKSFSDKLGQGGYGNVYRGTLPDGTLVAVKVLNEADSDGEEFINEVASISRTSHVNIVTLLGFCYDNNTRALVYEFMPNKSLDNFLSNKNSAANADSSLDLQKLYEISVGIAKGLEYLHTGCSTRIVHFDIKPQNILLDEDFCPKISDFGLAKLCKKKQSVLSVIGTRGTVGYIAPEVFSRNFGGVSYKSDVYSYGMMVLEMAGANKMVEASTVQSSENYFPDKIYEHVIHGVTRKLDDFVIEDAEEIAQKMFLVGFWCIQTSPSDRPPMSKVVEMLEGRVESIQIPPKPVLFTPAPPVQNISSSRSSYVETESSAESEIRLVRNIKKNK